MSAVLEKRKEQPMVQPARVHLAEFERQDWIANVEIGTTVEQLQDPAYWSLVAAKMKPFDAIEVRAEDGSWVAHLIVVEPGKNYAHVKLDRVVQLRNFGIEAERQKKVSVRHKVMHKGAHMKWCIVRIADSAVIKQGLDDEVSALQELREYENRV